MSLILTKVNYLNQELLSIKILGIIEMSGSTQEIKIEQQVTTCYLCSMNVPLDKSMEIPLTTGGTVRVHPSCMEFYMSKTSVASGCAGCTGGKGCC